MGIRSAVPSSAAHRQCSPAEMAVSHLSFRDGEKNRKSRNTQNRTHCDGSSGLERQLGRAISPRMRSAWILSCGSSADKRRRLSAQFRTVGDLIHGRRKRNGRLWRTILELFCSLISGGNRGFRSGESGVPDPQSRRLSTGSLMLPGRPPRARRGRALRSVTYPKKTGDLRECLIQHQGLQHNLVKFPLALRRERGFSFLMTAAKLPSD